MVGSLCHDIQAETVSRKEAFRIAHTFLNAVNHRKVGNPQLLYNGKELTTHRLFPPFYVFGLPTGGYVVVAAENKAMPILAYSSKGDFSQAKESDEFKMRLEEYARDIEMIRYDSRMPVEAIAAWADIHYYIGEMLEKGRGSADNGDIGYMAEAATEFRYQSSEEEVEMEVEEDVPFLFHENFVAETRASLLESYRRIEEKLHPVEPVLRHIGGGHFEVFMPEKIESFSVYDLQGNVMYDKKCDGTDTVVVKLDSYPSGFYLLQMRDVKGKRYGMKLYK